MTIQAPRGTLDVLPADQPRRLAVLDAARSAAEARTLFEAKGNIVSAATAAGFATPAEIGSANVRRTGRRR